MRHLWIAWLTLSTVMVGPPQAQARDGAVEAVFEKYKLIGTFAVDCSKPASKDNLYFVNRLLDASRVQRDQMSSPTARDYVTIIDKVSELRPNEIAYAGTRDGQPTEGVWRLEANRQIGMEVSMAGKKVISGGRLVSSGQPVPWLSRCDGYAESFGAAARADDRATCLSNQKTSEQRAACTRAITSGQISGGRDLASAYNVLGVTYHDAREYDNAIVHFDEAIKIAPDYSIAHQNRGGAYRAKGELDRAIQDFDEAIRLDAKSGSARNDRGVTYYMKGDYDRSILDFSGAIQLDAKSAVYYFNRGGAYEKKGARGEALADYRKTLSLNPQHQSAAEAIKRIEQ